MCRKHAVFSITSRKKSEEDTTASFFISLSVPHSSLRHHSLPEGGKIPLRTLSKRYFSGDPGRMLVWSKWWKHLELLATPIPSGCLFFLDAMEFVVCGIPAVLKFSRDVISTLMGQKEKSCSYLKDWFPTWFLKLHVTRFILQNKMNIMSVLMDEQRTVGLFQINSPNASTLMNAAVFV